MKPRFYICIPALFLAFLSADCQKISKADKVTLANLQAHVHALDADTAGGRRMGMEGEKKTGDYIISALSQAGVRPKGDDNGWLQVFSVDDGRQIGADASFTVDGQPLALHTDWFPLSLCPAGQVSGSPAIALQESGVPWFVDLKDLLEADGGAQANIADAIRAKATSCAKKGATALIVYNSSARHADKLRFDPKDRPQPAPIPVVYLTHEAKKKYFPDESASSDLRIRISYAEKSRTGHNVVGFLDNSAATTAIITTRYANISGLAGMIELARLLVASKFRANNYLFLICSGSDAGGAGADYYAGHPATDLKKVNYVLELGHLGELDGHALFVGGYHSSPSWPQITGAIRDKKAITPQADSSADGAGDHSIFLQQQIPVLVLSTAPGFGDEPAGTVNYTGELQVVKYIYSLIGAANPRGKLSFTP
ncbi:MAG TPA: M28 family peptidase [Puia sp.]|nr:M28 family peptidase [Puia sp.]